MSGLNGLEGEKCVPRGLPRLVFECVRSFPLNILAYYNDIVVGAVCCRVDKSDNGRRLYIMTLGCLAPYRRLGIGKLNIYLISNAKVLGMARCFEEFKRQY